MRARVCAYIPSIRAVFINLISRHNTAREQILHHTHAPSSAREIEHRFVLIVSVTGIYKEQCEENNLDVKSAHKLEREGKYKTRA